MTPEQQVLQRILLSRHFAYADALKRILQYLCDHAVGPEARPIKEYEIAVFALGRPDSFDAKTDPVVRVSVAGIRKRLEAYFVTEGRNERLVMTIPKGRYHALFTERETAAPGPPDRRALRRFWAAYATPELANVVTYTEPLFYRDDAAGTYVRNIYVNDRNAPATDIRGRAPVPDSMPLRPCFHYLSSGEIQASISLSRLFQELGFPLDLRNARLSSVNDIRHVNLILLGSVRTNHLVDALMGSQGFLMTPTTLENPQPRPGEEKVYQGSHYLDGKLPRSNDYVLVSRRPGLAPGTTITIVASHHGRAVQGVGTMLTIETEVASLLDSMGLAGEGQLPPSFQALLQAEMIDDDDEVVSIKHVTHRIFA